MIDSSVLAARICTGCYFRALQDMPEDEQTRVMTLPELVEMAAGREK